MVSEPSVVSLVCTHIQGFMSALPPDIFLFGLAGVLGKLFSVPATAIVVGRTVMGAVVLLPCASARIRRADVPARVWLKLAPSFPERGDLGTRVRYLMCFVHDRESS
jgi:hypothetical protein